VDPIKIDRKVGYKLWKSIEIQKMKATILPTEEEPDQGRDWMDIDPDDLAFDKPDKNEEDDPFTLWVRVKTTISQ